MNQLIIWYVRVLQEDNFHPIVRLGWRRLCDVHCNGLTGYFLGGHDKDLFVQCTGTKWQNAPLIDEKLGGCIMTCSQFEKACAPTGILALQACA
jgi:hypothetical protein